MGQKGRRESGGLDDPELGEVPVGSFCLSISFVAGIVDRNSGGARYLASFLPEVGGGDLKVGFVSCVVSSKDADVGFTHCFFPVPRGEVERHSWVVEIIQPDTDYLVFILKEFVNHGRVVGLILFWDCLRSSVGVPECLDALQDFVLHLEFVEVGLEWVKRGDAGDIFLGPGKSGEVIRQHVGSLFVLYHEVMLQ